MIVMEHEVYRQILKMRALERWENEGGMICHSTKLVESHPNDQLLVVPRHDDLERRRADNQVKSAEV